MLESTWLGRQEVIGHFVARALEALADVTRLSHTVSEPLGDDELELGIERLRAHARVKSDTTLATLADVFAACPNRQRVQELLSNAIALHDVCL